jgi:DNA-directed RNA polymerase specialized sigma24 family protein
MAARLARQLHVEHEIEDVIQTGLVGLLKAASTYNPSIGATERFWAWSRVRLEILSAYSTGARQHSGGDASWWATQTDPLTAAAQKTAPETPPPPGLPCIDCLQSLQQELLRLIYEDGLSERTIAAKHLLGAAAHTKSKRPVAISRRRVAKEHAAALERLRQLGWRRTA